MTRRCFDTGWNPNADITLSACPSLLDVVFANVAPYEPTPATRTANFGGVIGHRTCVTFDITDVSVSVPSLNRADPAAFTVTCEGFEIATPTENCVACGGTASGAGGTTTATLSCDNVRVSMTPQGLIINFGMGVSLCPGCFIVGGRNNVMVSAAAVASIATPFAVFTAGAPMAPFCGQNASLVPAPTPVRPCNAETMAEYRGTPITLGQFLAPSPEACCLACQENPSCNVWTFCTADAGCGGWSGTNEYMFSYSQCDLKYAPAEDVTRVPIPANRGPNVTYTRYFFPGATARA